MIQLNPNQFLVLAAVADTAVVLVVVDSIMKEKINKYL
jgi:hypothetical protein